MKRPNEMRARRARRVTRREHQKRRTRRARLECSRWYLKGPVDHRPDPITAMIERLGL